MTSPQFTYLEIRHDASGLLEISNQYTLAFDRDQFRKIVVILKGRPDPSAVERIPADEIIFLQCSRLGGLNLKAVAALIRICRQHQVTHILTHRFKPAQIAGLTAIFLRPMMLICVIHGNHQFDRLSRRIASRLLFAGEKVKLVGVSGTTREDIIKHLPFKSGTEITGVPNCIDIGRTEQQLVDTQTARKRLQIDAQSFVFGNIGRLSPAKDQLSMIRAFHTVQSSMPNAVLIIIGGGRLEADLKQECKRLGTGNRVVFSGSVDQAWQLMNAFDCFVSTSVTEGFGLVIVEAMVAKRPIIATRIGSFEEILGDEVELVDCGNIEAIANAMLEQFSASSKTRDGTGLRLYDRVCTHFSTPVFRKRVKQIYSENQ